MMVMRMAGGYDAHTRFASQGDSNDDHAHGRRHDDTDDCDGDADDDACCTCDKRR